jgi:hypothetical protein
MSQFTTNTQENNNTLNIIENNDNNDNNDSNTEVENEEEFDESKYLTIRGKWIYDGCSNIDEMIESLKNQITELENLKKDGWELENVSFDDYAILINNKDT